MNCSKHLIITLIALSPLSLLYAQDELRAYEIYNSSGQKMPFSEMVDAAREVDVVFFGELHNNPIDHWLQLELVKALHASDSLVLAAEMFETDDQVVLDEYLDGKMKVSQFEKEAKLWPNYETDYAPLVNYASEHGLKFIASNVPRRYASLVSREGQGALLELSDEAIAFLPKLPFEVTPEDRGYEEMRNMMGGGHGMGMNLDHLVEAQALKDYTMASSILPYVGDENIVVHFNGSFHSNYNAGICGYLSAEKEDVQMLVISSVESTDMTFDKEWAELGDFILVKPENMTKTH